MASTTSGGVDATSATELISCDPATGEPVGAVPITPVSGIEALTRRARQAQHTWGAISIEERAALLLPAAERLKSAIDELALLATREMGKPIADATGEASHAASGLGDLVAECVEALAPRELEDAQRRSTLLYQPYGVCAAITPWNFPIGMPQESVIPALVAGNTVILKPSEETPLTAQAWLRRVAEGLPPDVLQIMFGDETQGKALVAGDVDLIVFTGSRNAGRQILENAGRQLKRVILELGGKDPLVVLPDADLERAASFAARNSFRNAGQVCVSTERIFVHRSIAEEFERRVAEKAAALKQGPGTGADVTIGPMVNRRQKDHVLSQIESAVSQGARILIGDEAREGNFVAPTVLVEVRPDMDIMQEETFGPVACIIRYDDVEEAIRWANASPYALGGAVFGGNEEAAEAVARKLDSAMVGINQGCGGAKGTPWVGAKQSGYGYHSGPEGHRQFAQVRVISRAKGG